mgnify:CR=1 FL=1|jgi:hypothetical protein
MASFTYTVWSNESATDVLARLRDMLVQLGFSLENSRTGMCHVWDEEGECSLVDVHSLCNVESQKLPLGVQWWRDEEDIFVTLAPEKSVGGTTCYVCLVGLARAEQAEVARLLILHIVPGKQEFPDDFPVFQLSAQ